MPRGEGYDADATMHVSFAEHFAEFAAGPPGADPLAAPGHGYVPPHTADAPHDGYHPYAAGEFTGGAEPAGYDYGGHPQAPASPWEESAAAQRAAEWQQSAGTHQWAPPHEPSHEPGPEGEPAPWSAPFTAGDTGDDSGEYPVGAAIDQAAHPHPEPRPEPHPRPDPAEPAPAPEAEAAPEAPEAPAAPGPDAVPEPEPVPEPGPEPEAAAGEAAGLPDVPEVPDAHSEHSTASYVLHVNGVDRPVTDAWLGESLLYVLRERLGLAGAKDGCEQGECGACSVQVDGRLVASCLTPAATAAGSEVRTVEGLARDGMPSDVQRALVDHGAVQCGFCVPGLAMTLHDLLEGNHRPTELETRQAICGNLCRCSGYQGVLAAVRQVVAEREATAAEEPAAPDSAAGRIPHQATAEPDPAPPADGSAP
nr:(2Fe-2S)-binding protein [Streptomyces sp. SID5468]